MKTTAKYKTTAKCNPALYPLPFTLYLLPFTLYLFFSCDKIFLQVEGKNADLQGKWQMTTADTIYFNFQNNLFQFQVSGEKTVSSVFGYYQLKDDASEINIEMLTRSTTFPLAYLNWDTVSYKDDKKIQKLFEIKEFTRNKLVLSAEGEDLPFRKF